LSIPTGGAVMGFIGVFFAFITRPPSKPKKGKGRKKRKVLAEPDEPTEEVVVAPTKKKGKKRSKGKKRTR